MINRTDVVVSAILLAICGWLYYVTTTFEEVSPLFAQGMQPARFPRMILWIIALLSLGLPFERWQRKEEGKVLDKARANPILPIAYVTAAFLVVAVLAVRWIGTSLVLVLVCLGLPLLWGERRWRLIVPFVVLFPAAVMFLFAKILGVYFDPGVLGFAFP